ncbi:MBL fold metallo-hydrolase [Zoogloea sp.]|uniref:MBL fold metallo-hydrolase n=1 Tax=Zoogloea sp. TaxID=49181 RepID=UPI0035AFA553
MYFRQFFDPRSAAMSYLVADPACGQAAFIDPNPDPCQALVFRALLAERRLALATVLFTHAHGAALDGLADPYPGATVVAGAVPGSGDCFRQAVDGEVLRVGNEAIRVIATPGHTAASVSYLWNDRLFCGDALELGGCTLAETDEGDPGRLYDSVTGRLFALPDEVLVFPGHDFHGRTVSTIGEERRRNPFFLARSRDAFVAAFQARQQADRRRPAFAAAVPANP